MTIDYLSALERFRVRNLALLLFLGGLIFGGNLVGGLIFGVIFGIFRYHKIISGLKANVVPENSK